MKHLSSGRGRGEGTKRFQLAFWSAKRAISEASEAAFGRHGVRAGQQFILRCLWDEDGLTPGQIARQLDLATPTVTKATTRMEATGLLIRRSHPTDRRLVRLYLTPRGRSLRDDIDGEVDRLTERALRGLGDGQRDLLVGFLQGIARNLSRADVPAAGPAEGTESEPLPQR